MKRLRDDVVCRIRRPSGWKKVRYLDIAGLGAIVVVAISSFFAVTPFLSAAAIAIGATAGTVLTWFMKRRERTHVTALEHHHQPS
jgi:xanthine/uracil permease